MIKLKAYIKISRPLNLMLALLSIIISAHLIEALDAHILPYICVLVLCFIAASNILNDIFDFKIDKINQPDRVLVSGQIKIKEAFLLMFVLFTLGLLLTYYIHPLARKIVIWIVFPLLLIYTPFLKRMPLLGNIIIGFLLGFVFIFTEISIFGNVSKMWIPFVLSSGLSIIRELVKDAADIKGDTIYDLMTFPRKFGLKTTLIALRAMSLLLFILSLIPVITGLYGKTYLTLLLTLVILPLFWIMLFKLSYRSSSNDYKKSAYILKGITIGGIITIFSISL